VQTRRGESLGGEEVEEAQTTIYLPTIICNDISNKLTAISSMVAEQRTPALVFVFYGLAVKTGSIALQKFFFFFFPTLKCFFWVMFFFNIRLKNP